MKKDNVKQISNPEVIQTGFGFPITGRPYMSRRIVTIDESGCTTVHPLSIVRIDEGQLYLVPFEREIAGVEYTDSVITCICKDGRWSMTFD